MESLAITILFFIAANYVFLRASSAHNISAFLDCLANQFQTSILDSQVIHIPNNASFTSTFESSAWNLRVTSQKPDAIITPKHESQLQSTVRCSKEHSVHIRVRSGGHDYDGLSYISECPFVIIDMRNLRAISINTRANTAWIRTGATLGQLYYTIAKRSKTLAFTGGACPTVGVGGYVSGGGYGMMSRKHGIAVDHIIDAKVIDTEGEILNRKSMGENLFWAIRGGGGPSFGIVLAYKVRLVRVPETVTVFNVSRTLQQNATQLVHKWQYISDKLDENLLVRLFLRKVTRTIRACFTSLFLGRVDDLLPIVQEKFPELGLLKQDCIEMSWIESVLFFAGHKQDSVHVLLNRTFGSRIHYKGKSDYVRRPIPEDGLEGIWKFLNETDEMKAALQLSPYGGIMSRISESETPFPHRAGNIYMIHYLVYRYTKEESERHIKWINRLYDYMTPYVSNSPRRAYFNYRDLEIGRNNKHGMTSYSKASIWGLKYFKNNFERLVRVKTKFDPSNFFRNEQSIIPSLQLSSQYKD